MTTTHPKTPIELLPCPFCEGDAVECWSKKRYEPVGKLWVEGTATAYIACGKCGARGKEYRLDCGRKEATNTDVDEALIHARIYWNARPVNDNSAWQDAAKEVMENLLDAHRRLDSMAMRKALKGMSILVGASGTLKRCHGS